MIAFFLALFPAVVAALPLFGARFIPTHDGEYHIIRFWQFYKMLTSGDWFPRWAPDLNNGLGIPLFTFNYPLPNYIGSFFHAAGLSFVDSFKWSLGLGYVSSVILYYLFIKKLFGTRPAVLATIIFSYVPYWFVYLYVRGSVGEVWAVSFLMLACAALVYTKPAVFALAVGFLILSHNILAMLFIPILFVVCLRLRPMLLGWATGVGLATYFWFPALYERQFVVGLNTVNYRDHFPAVIQLLFPSWGTGHSGPGIADGMSFQIGIVPLLIIITAIFILIRSRRVSPYVNQISLAAVFLFMGAAFLMTEYSGFVWSWIPALQFMQFPWRFLCVTMISVSVLAGLVCNVFPKLGIALALCSVLFAFSYTRPVTYEPRTDEYYLSRDWFTSGTSSMGDVFQTTWKQKDSRYTPGHFLFLGDSVEAVSHSPVSFTLTVDATTAGTLISPIAYYPGWYAKVDERWVSIAPSKRGVVMLPVDLGTHSVRIWLGSTVWQVTAAVISILSLLTAGVSFILKK